jgi:hypothetical protein
VPTADGKGRTLAFVVTAAAYSFGAATTTPFTAAADVVTALPVIAVVLSAVLCWPVRPGSAGPRVPHEAPDAAATPSAAHPYRAWIGLLVVVVAFELLEYFARGSRGAHPTLSSMADAVDRHVGLKALVFFAWLCLGAAIVVAGRGVKGQDGIGGRVARR